MFWYQDACQVYGGHPHLKHVQIAHTHKSSKRTHERTKKVFLDLVGDLVTYIFTLMMSAQITERMKKV